jgi:hypothetical protein
MELSPKLLLLQTVSGSGTIINNAEISLEFLVRMAPNVQAPQHHQLRAFAQIERAVLSAEGCELMVRLDLILRLWFLV